MSDTRLKHCPFCGGEAKKTFINWKPAIQCKTCKANVYREYLEQVEGAEILLWNTRKPIDRIVEQLEELKSDWNDDYNVPITKAINIVKGDDENE